MICVPHYIDCLVQDFSNSRAFAMELLQSCTKPLTYPTTADIDPNVPNFTEVGSMGDLMFWHESVPHEKSNNK